jgi:hypothetical protein
VSGALSGRGKGRKIKEALLARETVEQVDDFAGRVKSKRVEVARRRHDVLSCGKAEPWPAAAWEVVANLEARCASCTRRGGRRFRVALLPAGIPASREPGLRLNPQLRRIPADMRAELTSAEIAMSG